MDKKAIGSLVLVLLLVGSIIGMGLNYLLEARDGGGEEEVPAEPTPADEPQIYYVAQNLDANIFELSQLYPIKGYTSETNLSKITGALSMLESIDRIFSAEFQNPEPERERFMPVYVEISIKDGYAIEATISEITGKGILSDVLASRKAVVKIPALVSLKSAKADLNLSKDVNFEEPFAGAIVSTDAIVGDEVKVLLSLSMKGNEIVRETMIAYMSENISATPQFHLTQTKGSIARLDNFLGFERTIQYKGFDQAALKAVLGALDGVQKAEVLLDQIGGSFALDINTEGLDVNALEQDINSAFTAIEGISRVSFSESEGMLNARIAYAPETGYPKIRPAAIAEAAAILAGKDYAFVDPNADLNCILFLSGGSPEETAFEAKKVFSSFGIDGNFWQQAFFDINSLADSQTGEEFAFPKGFSELPVRVAPGSEIGRELDLQIVFQTTRKSIDIAYATEIGS